MWTMVYAGGLAVVSGFIAASLLRWLYVLLTGEMLGYRHLVQPGFYQPVRALAVMMSGPDIMLAWAIRTMTRHKLAGFIMLALSLGWSFILGVVILTKVFGYT